MFHRILLQYFVKFHSHLIENLSIIFKLLIIFRLKAKFLSSQWFTNARIHILYLDLNGNIVIYLRYTNLVCIENHLKIVQIQHFHQKMELCFSQTDYFNFDWPH